MPLMRKVDREHPDTETLELAAGILRRGGVIVYPTETVYGIGANALDAAAVRKVQEVKARKAPKPILLIIGDKSALHALTTGISGEAEMLIDAFWPGPLTLICNASAMVPEAVTQGTGTVGVRVPSSPFCRGLMRLCPWPVTSTSANISGMPVHRTIGEIREALGPGVDLFLDAGTLPESLPSTVVDVAHGRPRLLRAGAIPAARIGEVLATFDPGPHD